MIISTATQKYPAKVWKDSFVAVNLNPHHHLYFSGWINKIAPDVKTGETEHFRNHEGYYYDTIPSVWKHMSVIKIREVMHVIDRFTSETPHGNSMWKKKFVLSLICFVPLDQISNIKYAVRLRVNILR